MKKTKKMVLSISLGLIGVAGVLNALPASAAPSAAVAESEVRTLRVQFEVNGTHLQCLPADKNSFFLPGKAQLLFRSHEISRYFRNLGNRPLTKWYESFELCTKARTVILGEAFRQGGWLERTLRVVYTPKDYHWLGDDCFENEREFASLFLGLETGFGEIGPSVSDSVHKNHFKVDRSRCGEPEYPY